MFFSSTSIFFSLLFLARDGVGLFSALRSRAERKGSSSGDREKITRKTNERRSKTKSSSREKRKRNLNLFSPLLQKPLHQFDSAFLAALSTKVAGRASFKGGLTVEQGRRCGGSGHYGVRERERREDKEEE